jgi:ABC-type spermidine/putrescine transport system permease subunit II
VVGVPIAWILARTRLPGRDTLDGLITLILALPGTAIGIAYIRAFHFELPGLDLKLTSLWIVLPLVLCIRRLPYTVRGAYASLLLVHRSLEEAAASVGATGARSFRDVTLPLIWRGVLVGSLFSFMTSLQEASAVLFLSLGGWETIPVGIFVFYIAGSANEAAALGVILIVVAALCVLVINRVAGSRMGGMFGYRLCEPMTGSRRDSATKSAACDGLWASGCCASVSLHMAPSGEQSAWKALGELSTIGLALVIATVLGLAGGYYLDRWLGTSPWLTLIGLVFGIAAGFVNLFRSVKRAEKNVDDRE